MLFARNASSFPPIAGYLLMTALCALTYYSVLLIAAHFVYRAVAVVRCVALVEQAKNLGTAR